MGVNVLCSPPQHENVTRFFVGHFCCLGGGFIVCEGDPKWVGFGGWMILGSVLFVMFIYFPTICSFENDAVDGKKSCTT